MTAQTGLPAGRAVDTVSQGEMAERVRMFDWSRTVLGPMDAWSPALRTTTNLLLANRFPMLLWWGPDYISIYNDAYVPILGTKHPGALGQPVADVWGEIWGVLKPLIDTPFAGGPATWNEDIELELHRHGFVEETHFTIAYSPVPDEAAVTGIGGVLATVHEISEQVVSDRRVTALRDLGTATMAATTAREACEMALASLAPDDRDVPFALIYLVEGTTARLAATLAVDEAASRPAFGIELGEGDGNGPFSHVLRSQSTVITGDMGAILGGRVPPGRWSDAPSQVAILPLASSVPSEPAGFLVAGISSRLPLDDRYQGFLELVASQVAGAIARVRAYEQERQRAEALAELDRAKTAFFSNVSHEFRTPLTLLLGPIEESLAEPEGVLRERDRERLQIAYRNARRLLRLVNTMLDFSRIEEGRVDASFEPTDVALLTADLASQFRSAIERAGLRLEIDAPALTDQPYVDREMWEKIVLNLLSNALKATFEGEIAVRVQGGPSEVTLTVADTGIGIPAEEQDRIFERFHRVSQARSRTHEGTGIGLALVQELVAIHGGSISVASAVDVGTTFTVSIPLGRAHLTPERLHAPRALASTTLGAGPFVEEALRWLPDDLADPLGDDARPVIAADMEPDARLLVVDDNADMRAYLVHLLGSQWSVDVASNGEDALRLLRERRADLVITDVMMPGLTGFELIDAIRHDPDISSVPVIALSARAGEESRADGLDAGADDYVVKPFSARELTARVGASLKLARLRRETLVEHERSAVALRQAHEKYQALVWSTADSVWEADATGAIDVDAPSWRAVTGQSAADWIGFGWLDALHPDDRVRVEREWRDRITDSTTFDIEFRVRDQRGGWRWISLRAAPLPSAGGRAPRWIGMNTDITARRQAEEARDAFVGVLSHELRTPVTTILAASELLAQPGRDRDPAMTDELTRDVVGEARRLQRLVEDLLVLSRAERSELVVETEPVLIHHAIRAAVGAESVRFPNVRFDVDAPALPPVMADRTYVEQVLRNYVSNAAKYGGDMANVIVVAREEEAAITVRILDDGPGFPEASAGRLFDLFFRDPEAMRRQPGAGIGLFVTRTLVEAMGGQVWAKARDGGGAEFGFSLPAGDLE